LSALAECFATRRLRGETCNAISAKTRCHEHALRNLDRDVLHHWPMMVTHSRRYRQACVTAFPHAGMNWA
jgi:hypothetical protein